MPITVYGKRPALSSQRQRAMQPHQFDIWAAAIILAILAITNACLWWTVITR
jgi:hypothetical protein